MTTSPIEKRLLAKNHKIVCQCLFFAQNASFCASGANLIYSHEMDLVEVEHRALEIPKGCSNAIVMAIEMDYEENRRTPAIEPATTLGYATISNHTHDMTYAIKEETLSTPSTRPRDAAADCIYWKSPACSSWPQHNTLSVQVHHHFL